MTAELEGWYYQGDGTKGYRSDWAQLVVDGKVVGCGSLDAMLHLSKLYPKEGYLHFLTRYYL